MISFKKAFIAVFSAAAVFTVLPSAVPQASAASVSTTTDAHLKINDYYVLYTAPKAPYIDAKQRLMIPLRSVSELFGADVKYDAAKKTAVLSMDGHRIAVTNGSKTMTLDNRKVDMDTKPVIDQNSMILPLKVLLDGFGIRADIDPSYGYVNIRDSRLLKTPKIAGAEEFDHAMDGHIADPNAFVPLSAVISVKSSASGSPTDHVSVSIKAKNITGKAIPEGREDLHPLFLAKNSYVLDSDQTSADAPPRSRAAVKANETIQRIWDFSLEPNDPLLYVLVKGRTFDMRIP